MREFAEAALDAARTRGASYADVRVVRLRTQNISASDDRITNVHEGESFGAGVRVLVEGGWGFAASSMVGKGEAGPLAARAAAVARAAGPPKSRSIHLTPPHPVQDVWQTPIQKDPFRVPLEPKADLLLAICKAALEVKGASFCDASMSFVREEKLFASSEGAVIEQVLVRSHPTFLVTSVDRATGDFQTRRSLARPVGLGYEYVDSYPWMDEAHLAAEEAARKHEAPPVEPGRRAIVLHPSNLWLTIHETIGHATELDRILGFEANEAGASFIKLSDRGALRCAAEIVNIDGDRTQEGALATAGFDDEGVACRRWPIVKDGVLTDLQTTRELAAAIGLQTSHGCSRADSWASPPMQRMPNVSLLPGSRDIGAEEAIAATEDGIYVVGDGSSSIDQQRSDFQFGGQTAWEIRDGRITRMLKDVVYQSSALEFWRSCDLVGGESSYEIGGTFSDGKGEPGQANAVSHGCPVARFRDVTILSARPPGGRRA
jgi:TldD protein